MKQSFDFEYNSEIGIDTPVLHKPYDELTKDEIAELHHRCDQISGLIPERIRVFEEKYKEVYKNLSEQESEEEFYSGVDRLNEISRNICELNVWYLRMQGKFLTSTVE